MAACRDFTAGLALLLLGVLLSACSVGGALPPAPDGKSIPTDVMVIATNGERLAAVEWIPESPRAVILGVHGYGGYGELTFRRAAEFWKVQGIATISYDQRGFGRNASFGYWPGPEGLIDDAVSISKQVRKRFPGLPLVVVGHSMGGGVITAAETRGMEADRLVLAGPAIWGGSLLNPIYRASAWLAAGLFPERRLSGKGVVRIQASDNIEALRELGRDARYLAPPSARELHGLVALTDIAEEAAEEVTAPSLMLLGTKDQIVVNPAARKTFDRFAGEKHVVEYPDGWHLLFRDLQAEIVWQDVADWVLHGTPPTQPNATPQG